MRPGMPPDSSARPHGQWSSLVVGAAVLTWAVVSTSACSDGELAGDSPDAEPADSGASLAADAASDANPELDAVLAEIRSGPRYHQPTPQDAEGRGIFPRADEADARSEPTYPPFVLGPRRQTDVMVRQLYQLLPANIRASTAFVIADRLAQAPDAYLPYIQSRQRIVIIGNFVGIGSATSDQDWFLQRHATELWMADVSVRLAQAAGLEVAAVHYTMGDSSSSYAADVRDRLQGQLDARLAKLGLSELPASISWGADESVAIAFAAMLPPMTVHIEYETDTCRHYYDGNKTSAEVIAGKLPELGLVAVDDDADFDVFVLTNATDSDGAFPDPSSQRALDETRFGAYRSLPAPQRRRLAIIDGRMFNGAWDAYSAPPHCDYLAFGSWGTFANKVGSTLATAKILAHADNPAAQRQLLVEAIAHDVYANGYRDGRTVFSPVLADRGVTFDHFYGYDDAADVTTVFDVVGDHVASSMASQFADSTCLGGRSLRVTPQLWRTFESEMHLVPGLAGEVTAVGVYRLDLDPAVFDPTYGSASLAPLTLQQLVDEGATPARAQ